MNQFEMRQLAYQSQLKSRALQVLLYLIDRANKEQTRKFYAFVSGWPGEGFNLTQP